MKWPEPQEPRSSLRVRGLNVRAHAVAPEKEKVSLTLDKPLVDEIRSQFGGRALSTSINELLDVPPAPWPSGFVHGPKDRRGHLVEDGLPYGSMSSVRYAGASAFDLAMNAAWASWSSGGGGSVRDVTGVPTATKNSSCPGGVHMHRSRAGAPEAFRKP